MAYANNKFKTVMLFIILLLIGILFVLQLIGNICPLTLISNSPGEPIIVTRNSDLLFTGVTQIVSDDNNIYILFGTYSVVQVYTQEGEYKYTISVYNHMNGRTEIAVHDNHLYIRDKLGNIYVFYGDQFINLIDRTEVTHFAATLPYGAYDSAYRVHLGSIFKLVENENEECVIKRPLILTIYQNNLIFCMQFFLILVTGFILFLPVMKKRG